MKKQLMSIAALAMFAGAAQAQVVLSEVYENACWRTCSSRGVDLRRLLLEAVVQTAMDEGREEELMGLRSGVVQSMKARERNTERVNRRKNLIPLRLAAKNSQTNRPSSVGSS